MSVSGVVDTALASLMTQSALESCELSPMQRWCCNKSTVPNNLPHVTAPLMNAPACLRLSIARCFGPKIRAGDNESGLERGPSCDEAIGDQRQEADFRPGAVTFMQNSDLLGRPPERPFGVTTQAPIPHSGTAGSCSWRKTQTRLPLVSPGSLTIMSVQSGPEGICRT